MLRPFSLAACAFLVLAAAACSDSSGPETPALAVSGVVLDTAGSPVADAAVVLDLDFVDEAATAARKPQTAIGFSLSEPGRVSVRITDACDDEVFYALDDSLPAGQHQITWDGTDGDGLQLVEGFYHARIQFEGHGPATHELALARNLGDETGVFATVDGATVRRTWRVAAWTDQDGRFRIASRCWDFGRSTIATDETGAVIGTVTVASRVRAWVYPTDEAVGATGGWVDFDPRTGAGTTVIVGPPVPGAAEGT